MSILDPSVSTEKIDITLMVCLLKYVFGMCIGDLLPFDPETSDEAAITSVKFYRNFIAHGQKDCISDKKYMEICQKLVKVI